MQTERILILDFGGQYGQLIALLVACMLVIALVANPILVFILTRKNPYPLVLRCLSRGENFPRFSLAFSQEIRYNIRRFRFAGI